jgi:hypothetical protein
MKNNLLKIFHRQGGEKARSKFQNPLPNKNPPKQPKGGFSDSANKSLDVLKPNEAKFRSQKRAICPSPVSQSQRSLRKQASTKPRQNPHATKTTHW